MDSEDRIEIYTIPPNFAEEGTILSGRVKTRNAVETAALLIVLAPAVASLQVTLKVKIYIGMVVLVPVLILGVMGLQEESLFAFVASFFRFLRRRRILHPPDAVYRLEQNRRKEKSLRGGKGQSASGEARTAEKKAVESAASQSSKGAEKTKKRGRFPFQGVKAGEKE